MTLLNNSLLSELAKTKGELARARMQLYVDKNLTIPSQPQTQAAGLQHANPGHSQPSSWGTQPQFPLPAQDALEPEIEASIAETIARVQQQIQERGPTLAGVPVNPSPEEVGGVDTIL